MTMTAKFIYQGLEVEMSGAPDEVAALLRQLASPFQWAPPAFVWPQQMLWPSPLSPVTITSDRVTCS